MVSKKKILIISFHVIIDDNLFKYKHLVYNSKTCLQAIQHLALGCLQTPDIEDRTQNLLTWELYF